MHRRRLLALAGALTAGAIAGCADRFPMNGETRAQGAPGIEPDIDDEELRALVAETNGFTFDLYEQLVLDTSDDNLFVSPVSIAIAMAMTYAGAEGDTREQMRETLRYPLEGEVLHETFNGLQRALLEREAEAVIDRGGRYHEDDEPVPFELSIVNGLWGQEDYGFHDEFMQGIEDHYFADVQSVDFSAEPDATREEINRWVADHTGDRITELLPEGSIDGLVRLVLVNAIYFLANWKHPFPPDATETATFTALDGTTHDIDFMHENRSWKHATVDGTQVVELPYIGDSIAMSVLLPPDGEFESFERELDGETLASMLDQLEHRDGTVQLPRFTIESKMRLSNVLAALGMPDAFDPETADFTGMAGDEQLHIDEVYHDSWISVDEEGTEAAAATGVVMRTISAPADPFTFSANRPFLFVIRDRDTDTILFLGRVVDPTAWE